jgi:hypothetical protein
MIFFSTALLITGTIVASKYNNMTKQQTPPKAEISNGKKEK